VPDLHDHRRRHRVVGLALGDVPSQRQHDDESRYEPDAVNTSDGQWSGRPDAVPVGSPRTAPRPLRTVLFALTIVLGEVLLIGLGVWQVERRTWKLDLIDRVDRRGAAAGPAAPRAPAWAGKNPHPHEE